MTSTTLLAGTGEDMPDDPGEFPRPATAGADAHAPVVAPPGPRVAYVVSRFPRLTETFILTEAVAMVAAGVRLSLHPLRHERHGVAQPDATALAHLVDPSGLFSGAVARRQVAELARHPRVYLRTLAAVVRGTWGSRRFLVGGLVAFPYAVDLARRLEADGVEHVHCHFASHPAVVGFVVHRLTGIPFSFTAHGSDLHRDRHMLREKVEEAAFVATVSEHNRDVIVAACGPGSEAKVAVVRCGIDRARFPARARDRGDGPFRLLCTGTLHEVKGQRHLVDASAILVAAGREVRATLIGDGPDRRALSAQIASLGLEDVVELTGELRQPQVAELLAEADAVVVPSVPSADGRREGLPVVVLEALSAGVPVVASRLSGIPEAARDGETGLLAEPRDAAGLATAIGRLMDDPDLAVRLSAAGRALVAAEFDPAASAARLLDLIGGST
ncbi:MAG: glycosyltransferase [Acidimicrobiales bacterium]|nr:glycosyltransferase [Acidimicrobiales bacterium]